MINLENFCGKNAEITYVTGAKYKGFVDSYSSAYDNDDTEDSISVFPDKHSKTGIEVFQSEIKSIEIID